MPLVECELNYGSGFALKDPPKNIQGLKINLVWINQFPNATVSGTDFIWTNKNAQELWARKKSGTNGGTGITEGVGLRLYMWCGTTREMFFDGYIDVGNDKTRWETDMVHAPSVETGRVDWFMNKAKSIPLRVLAKLAVGAQGRIVPATDYKKVPYCVVKISQAPLQEALVAITELAVLKQGFETARDIATLTTKATGDAATATATLGAATPTVAATVVEIGFDVVYLLGCAITLLAEGKKIIDSIWQFKKYKLAMLERTHFQRICEYLGMQYSSTIHSPNSVHYNATWMPKKSVIPLKQNPLNLFTRPYDESINFPNNAKVYGHYDGNASDFIETMCKKYNAAINIQLNPQTGVRTLYFEEKHHWNDFGVFVVPNTSANGYAHNNPQPFGTNIMQLPWNYLLAFATDDTDEGTLYRYQGTTCEKTILQNQVGNKLWTTRGKAVDVELECARALRKDYLSRVENLLNNVINFLIQIVQDIVNAITAIYNAIAWIINLFGGNVQPITPYQLPTNLLNNRLGWMELTDDKFGTPKSFIGIPSGSDWKIHPNNDIYCTAEYLMTTLHQKNLPTHGAQQDLYYDKLFKFCCADYNAIRNKNVLTTPTGLLGNFVSVDWTVWTEQAEANYGIYVTETNNLIEKTSTDEN